jgi:hypothetical protein
MSATRSRKPYSERALVVRTTSRRFRAGTRKNKRLRNVGSFKSDRAAS